MSVVALRALSSSSGTGPWGQGKLMHARATGQVCHWGCDRKSRPQPFCVSTGGTVQQCQVAVRLSTARSTAGTSLAPLLLAKKMGEPRALYCYWEYRNVSTQWLVSPPSPAWSWG